MPNSEYPAPTAEIIATLLDLCRYQGRKELVEICSHATASFQPTNFDNWNGGNTTWALHFEIPVSIFATIESKLDAIEKELLSKLAYLDRQNPNDPIGCVVISPLSNSSNNPPPDIEVLRIWEEGKFRLFLSHLALHKVAVSKLKSELAVFGISGFVAHEDIEPTLQWMSEIELGLRSMQALVALLTTGFHESKWTDQEIGWALGRGVPVLPVRLGVDPYGFAGKYQGMRGDLLQPESLAFTIVDTLLQHPQTRRDMRRAFVVAFSNVVSFNQALNFKKRIIGLDEFTEEEKILLRKACADNDQISGAYGVVAAIHRKIGAPPAPKITNGIPF